MSLMTNVGQCLQHSKLMLDLIASNYVKQNVKYWEIKFCIMPKLSWQFSNELNYRLEIKIIYFLIHYILDGPKYHTIIITARCLYATCWQVHLSWLTLFRNWQIYTYDPFQFYWIKIHTEFSLVTLPGTVNPTKLTGKSYFGVVEI